MKICLTLIRPLVTYASETWTLNEHNKNRLCVFERQILRKTFGLLRTRENTWRIQSNAEHDHLIKGPDIVRFIKAQRIRLLGHIQGMGFSRMVERMLEWKPVESQRTGRPRI
jgi:hypothetical protein